MFPHPGAILCYHSITTDSLASESPVNVGLDEFLSDLDLLSLSSRIVPLRELVARHQAGRSIRGLVAITFDDAYHALLAAASVHLQQRDVPITVFTCSGPSERGSAFWWDRIEDLLPHLDDDGRTKLRKGVGMAVSDRGGESPDRGRDFAALREWILGRHRGRCPASLHDCLVELEVSTGRHTLHRAMTFEELASLRAVAPIDIGVHTVSHPVLPLLQEAEAIQEIIDCHRTLREHFPDSVPILAAPFGLLDEATLRSAKHAGMDVTLALGNKCISTEDGLHRFCMTRHTPTWRTALRLLGIAEHLRELRDGPAPAFPPIPGLA